MKKRIIFSLFFLSLLLLSNASLGQEHYFIVFCGNEGMPGHAFILFGRESQAEQASVVDGAWGLYPADSKQGGKSFIIGEVPGEIREEGLTKQCDYKLIREVSGQEYTNALSRKSEWTQRGRYELTKSDCVSFLIAIARCVQDIRIPERNGLDNFPSRYVKALFDLNN